MKLAPSTFKSKAKAFIQCLCFMSLSLMLSQGALAKPAKQKKIDVTQEDSVATNAADLGVGVGTTSADAADDGGNTMTFKTSDSSKPYVPQTELYPDGAIQKAYQQELVEIKALEDMKQKAYQAQEDYENKKVEAEKMIQAKRARIEETKVEQEKIYKDIDTFKNDLVAIEEKRTSYEKELAKVDETYQKTASESKVVRNELEKRKATLQIAITSAGTQRRDLEQRMSNEQIAMSKMRSEIAGAEVAIARTTNDRARYEAEYNRVHGEWQELDTRLTVLKEEKNQSAEELREAQRRLAGVQKDLANTKKLVADIQRDQQALDLQAKTTKAKTLAELKNLDVQTAEARNLKINYETEAARFDIQGQRLEAELASARDANDKARAEMEATRQIVMESHLKLETKKSDLSRLKAEGERDKINNDTFKVKVRDLASTMDASGMVEGGVQTWVSKKSCTLRKEPNGDSASMGTMAKGRSLMVQAVGDSGFVKVMNSSGKPIYVQAGCGDFN